MATAKEMADLAREVSRQISSPEDFSQFVLMLSSCLQDSALELQHAHQDKNAGKCWERAGRLLDKAAETVLA